MLQADKDKAQLLGDFMSNRGSKHLGKVAASYRPGVTLVDLSQPRDPSAVAMIRSEHKVWDVVLQSRRLFVSSDRAVEVYDVTNLQQPRLLSRFNLTGRIFDLSLYGDLLLSKLQGDPKHFRRGITRIKKALPAP